MAEYINREIAKWSLRMNQHRFTCADEANGFGSVKWSEDVIYAEAAQNAIDTIPSADVAEVRHGMWEDDGLVGIGAFGIEYRSQKCSECGYTFTKIPAQLLHKFCPNCGADMRTEGE